MSDISLTMLKERNITVQKHEYCPSERATIHEPEVILVTLTNARGESFQAKTFCSKRDHVLKPDEYIQLVIDRYSETEVQALKRTWQYKRWGYPVYMLSPRLAQPGYGGRCGNEFGYYHYDPGWYTRHIRKPAEAFRKRFELFAS